jgi:thiol-disulfide isomerase/thioredoxin
MTFRTIGPALIDLVAGLAAIAIVLFCCHAFTSIGADYRAIFALTGLVFFLAGVVRGMVHVGGLIWPSFWIGVPGLLGIAALIASRGPHRLPLLACLMICAFLAAAAGLETSRSWKTHKTIGFCVGVGSLFLLSATVWTVIPRISSYSAFETLQGQVVSYSFVVDQQRVSSTDLRGRVVILDFWSTTCPGCLLELPQVESVYQRFRNDPRVVFYFVDTGLAGNETPEGGNKTLARRHLAVPMAFDPGDAARAMRLDGLPALILIDANGAVRFEHRGYDSSEDLEWGLSRRIQKLLNERQSVTP